MFGIAESNFPEDPHRTHTAPSMSAEILDVKQYNKIPITVNEGEQLQENTICGSLTILSMFLIRKRTDIMDPKFAYV